MSAQQPISPKQVQPKPKSDQAVEIASNDSAKKEVNPEPLPKKVDETVLELRSSVGQVNVTLNGLELGKDADFN